MAKIRNKGNYSPPRFNINPHIRIKDPSTNRWKWQIYNQRASFEKTLVERLHSINRKLSFRRLVVPVYSRLPRIPPPVEIIPAKVLNYKPIKATICARRAIRKQVMHAKGIAGGLVSPPRYNKDSKVVCK